jgi:hypothetical protein
MDKETKDKLVKAAKKKSRSLPIMVMESDWYDYNAGARYLLVIIALSQRTSETAWLPEGLPAAYKEDKCLGWCDMTQARLAARRGCSESQVQKDIAMFRKDGVVQARGWVDPVTKSKHLMYRVVPEVVKERKRPSQDANDPSRPSKFAEPSPNRGRFTARKQPAKSMAAAAGVNEDDA